VNLCFCLHQFKEWEIISKIGKRGFGTAYTAMTIIGGFKVQARGTLAVFLSLSGSWNSSWKS